MSWYRINKSEDQQETDWRTLFLLGVTLLIYTAFFLIAAFPKMAAAQLTLGPDIAIGIESREVDGFRASAMFTSDPNWKEQWDTPTEHNPNLKSACCLSLGETATLLVFFQNPALRDGAFDLTCDIRVTDVDGSIQENHNVSCGRGPLVGPPNNIRMTPLHADISVDENTSAGTVTFEITVRDNVREVSVPLSVALEIRK